MCRLLLLVLGAALAGCAGITVTNEFNAVEPEQVAVVIGYEVAGSETIDPRLTTTAWWASLLVPGGPGLAMMWSSALINPLLMTDDAVTMVDELNTAVYRSLEQMLTAKGYQVRLLKIMPVAFASWPKKDVDKDYLARIAQNYQLSDADLQASGADTVLFLEYRIDAYIKDMEELQSMDAVDLKIDLVQRQALAFSLPPANKLMYRRRNISLLASWDRLTFEQMLAHVSDLEKWPALTP